MIKRGSVGDYDDDQFLDDELLYRRVLDDPEYLSAIDPITGKRRPTVAAFSYSGNGLSVSIHGLIRRHGLKTCHLCKNWGTHGVARFQARHVRPDAGVIEDPTDDLLIGKAHGLVRGPNGKPPRGVWNSIRDEILQHLVYFEYDPGEPQTTITEPPGAAEESEAPIAEAETASEPVPEV